MPGPALAGLGFGGSIRSLKLGGLVSTFIRLFGNLCRQPKPSIRLGSLNALIRESVAFIAVAAHSAACARHLSAVGRS
jgi:hypothetical protein